MSDWYSQQPDTLESIMGELAATDRLPPPPAPPTSALMPPRDSGVAEAQSYMEPVASGYNLRDRSAPDAWKKYDDAQLQQQVAPHSYLPYGVATQQEAEHAYRSTGESLRDWYLPTTTWGAGLTGATAAAAKSLPGPAKLAGLAAGFALSPSDADASFLRAPNGKTLTMAERMMKDGASPEAIWDMTRLTQGADGIWRNEVPDLGSRWRVDPMTLVGKKGLQLGSVFKHDQLFDAAPFLPKTELKVYRGDPNEGGAFLPGSSKRPDKIELNVDYAHDTPHGVIMHEGTHVIARNQDMAAGANISTNPLSAPAQEIYEKLMRDFQKMPSEAELRAQGIVTKDYSYKRFLKEYNAALSDPVALEQQMKKTAAEKAYLRSAGEAEARLTQYRANKGEEYLANVPPSRNYDVPIEQQIVQFNKPTQPRLPGLAIEPQQAKKVTGFAPSKGFAPGSIAEPPLPPLSTPIKKADLGYGPQLPNPTPELERPSIAERYLANPLRVANTGIYKRPDVIAREANELVAPEHDALKALFGVTRDDLYEISKQGTRKGNMEPNLWMPGKPTKPNEASMQVMTPANTQRLVDTLGEALKYPELTKGMVPWYVMDPMYQRMVQLVGPEEAKLAYMRFNANVSPFSAGSSVNTEINRGTAAHMYATRGDLPTFKKYGNVAEGKRGADFPDDLRDVKGHMMHGNQIDPVMRYAATGSHGYNKDTVKIPLYMGASGVPETGFQTRWAVPDTHFASAISMPEVRTSKDFRSFMGGTEYRPIAPWFRDKVAGQVGLEAVPGQALTWGTFAPQTGVRTGIGAGKLELLSQQIWERAIRLGIDPAKLRDDVMLGKEHALWILGLPTAGAVASKMGGVAEQRELKQ